MIQTIGHNAPHFIWGDGCDGWWLKQNGLFTVILEQMPPGSAEKKHLHCYTEQFFFVLKGTLTITLDDTRYVLSEEQSLVIPPSTAHHVSNQTHDNVRFLVVSCPDSHQDRIDL